MVFRDLAIGLAVLSLLPLLFGSFVVWEHVRRLLCDAETTGTMSQVYGMTTQLVADYVPNLDYSYWVGQTMYNMSMRQYLPVKLPRDYATHNPIVHYSSKHPQISYVSKNVIIINIVFGSAFILIGLWGLFMALPEIF